MRKVWSIESCILVLTVCLVAASLLPAAAAQDKAGDSDSLKSIKYRLIGPAAGGRVTRVAGVPGDPLVFYLASASGGVWKSSDGGYRWKPIFDDQPISSIGSLAVAPSNSQILYVGSGEANIRGNVAAGNGIYKSVDGGKSWSHVWKQEGQIGTLIVHPTNPDIAFAAVFGHAFGPNPERGIYRTTDGGKSWQNVLFEDADTGAADVCFDPSNANILFGGMWQARRRPWEMISGGPGSGLYTSRDGGATWKRLSGNGLPDGILGKIGVAVAPSDSRRVYALIEAEKGGLFRSDDGGETWTCVHSGHDIRQRAWYYSTLTVDPTNANVIWCPQVSLLRSIDGGSTFHNMKGLHHGDHHDLWIDPRNPKRIIAGNDGGVDISNNGGESWFAPPLPISQFYHVAADSRKPYYISGAMQDLGTASGPSNSLLTGGISLRDWHGVGGGEAGHTAHDPSDPNIVYAGEYGGYISRYDHRTRQARNVSVYPDNPSGHGSGDQRFRFQWTAPIAVSPHDPKVVYHGGNVLFRTSDGGMTWAAISPDLTRNDKGKQQWSGGPITGDNTGVEHYCTIFAVAESPVLRGVLWVGSDDGLVHVSRDAGKSWDNVTSNMAGFPEWGTVSLIEPSPFDAATAYVVVDAHRLDNMHPYLFKTTDYGKTWVSLGASLPQDIYLHSVREDPKRRGFLYLGTERGVAYSRDDGATWRPLKLNLPTVAVHDLIVKDDDLVVGTHGRSIWILDDLTCIRESNPELFAADLHLFQPRPAVRYRYGSSARDSSSFDNPPRGAALYYFLKSKPKDTVVLEIQDARGKLIRTLSSKLEEKEKGASDYDDEEEVRPALENEPGIHKAVWDLNYFGATLIKGAKLDGGDPAKGPMVLPGPYTLRMIVDGHTTGIQVAVEADPRVMVPVADLESQLQLALAIRDDITRLSQTVQQIRTVRDQITSLNGLLQGNLKAADLIQAGQHVVAQLDVLEDKLHNPKAQVVYDILAQRGGAKLYSKMAALLDAVRDADGRPTQGMHEVYSEYQQQLRGLTGEFQGLLRGPLAKLNDLARKLDLTRIIVPAP